MNAYKWSTTAASNNAAVPDGAPDGWLGANVNEWARETMASLRVQMSDAAYIDETYQLSPVGTKSITRNSDTQFTIQNCNATSHFTTRRRFRIVGSTTTHGFVTSSSYSAPDTIVNCETDADDVPTSPTQVLVHVDSRIRDSAYKRMGAGNGLDADTVDGYQAADFFAPSIFAESLTNGAMQVWQRGSSGSCSAGSRTYHADRWWTNPAGAAVTCDRVTTTPTGAVSRYAKKVTGATSVTTCEIAGQRIESYLIPYIKTTLTISALVKNETGANLTLDLVLSTPSVADDFSSVTQRFSGGFAPISSTASQRITQSVDISGYTNIDNGLQFVIRAPSGSLDSGGKSITITEIQIDRSSAFAFYRLRPIPDEQVRCGRYYRKTFAYETTPAQNWAGAGSGVPAGALVIPGSTAGASPNSGVYWPLDPPMRSTPTVTTFNPRAAAATAVELDGTGNQSVTATPSTSGISFEANAPAQAICFGAVAEAEL